MTRRQPDDLRTVLLHLVSLAVRPVPDGYGQPWVRMKRADAFADYAAHALVPLGPRRYYGAADLLAGMAEDHATQDEAGRDLPLVDFRRLASGVELLLARLDFDSRAWADFAADCGLDVDDLRIVAARRRFPVDRPLPASLLIVPPREAARVRRVEEADRRRETAERRAPDERLTRDDCRRLLRLLHEHVEATGAINPNLFRDDRRVQL